MTQQLVDENGWKMVGDSSMDNGWILDGQWLMFGRWIMDGRWIVVCSIMDTVLDNGRIIAG